MRLTQQHPLLEQRSRNRCCLRRRKVGAAHAAGMRVTRLAGASVTARILGNPASHSCTLLASRYRSRSPCQLAVTAVTIVLHLVLCSLVQNPYPTFSPLMATPPSPQTAILRTPYTPPPHICPYMPPPHVRPHTLPHRTFQRRPSTGAYVARSGRCCGRTRRTASSSVACKTLCSRRQSIGWRLCIA